MTKCECGCIVVFHGVVPKSHTCYRCGARLRIGEAESSTEAVRQKMIIDQTPTPSGFVRTK